MSQQDLLENEVIEELLREKSYYYISQNKNPDLWILISPEFLNNKQIKESLRNSSFYKQYKNQILVPLGLNVGTGVANYFSAGGNTNILSGGTHYETASTIHMNGPAATPATPATSLNLHENVRTSSEEKWEEKNRYSVKEPLKSIIRRIPMHEPWALHENFAPEFLTPDNTDREAE